MNRMCVGTIMETLSMQCSVVHSVPMLKSIDRWSNIHSSSCFFLPSVSCNNVVINYSCKSTCISSFGLYNSKPGNIRPTSCIVVHARRRIRYDEDDDEEGDGEEYGNNEDIAMLEYYSESVKEVALLVRAEVDEQDVEILIFKVSSCS